MEQGNPNKVSAIVDEIVRNNAMFKLKSPIERDKEKYSMEKSINTALSELNETGKELVLEELAVNPDEKFKGFIDNAGNIDISGILKFTSAVVKVKIEEAQREGINLRKDAPRVIKNQDTTGIDGLITLGALGVMVNNFKNLSREDRATVIDNWARLTREQRAEVMGDYSHIINDGADTLKNEKDKNIAKKFAEKLKADSEKIRTEKKGNLSEEQKDQKRQSGQQYLEYIKTTFPKLYEEFLQSLKDKNESLDGKDILEIIDIFEAFREEKSIRLALRLDEEIYSVNKGNQTRFSDELQEELETTMIIDNTRDMIMSGNYLNNQQKEAYNVDEILEVNGKSINQPQNEQKRERDSKEGFQTVINGTLKKIIGEKKAKEALEVYKNFIDEIDEEIINDLKTKSEDELIDFMKEYFEEFKDNMSSNSFEILQELAQNNFGGNLYKLLTNKQMLEEVLLPTLNSEMERLGANQELEVVTAQEKSKNEEDVTPITDTDVEQGVRQGTLKQEDLIVDTASVRTAQNEEEGRVNVEMLNAEQAEQGVNSKPFKNVSAFMGIIGDEKDNVAESDLEETLAELETASQMIEQDLQATQGNIGNSQTNLNQEQTIKEDEGIEQ